jgi:hypothetical protein
VYYGVQPLACLFRTFFCSVKNRAIRAQTQPREIQAGWRLEGLAAVDASGALATVKLPSAETERLLIITFSPNCPYSRANTPGYRRLAEALRARGSWRVVWISQNLEMATRRYCGEQHLPLGDVLWNPSHWTYNQLGLGAVPNVIAVDYGGVVGRVWRGELDPRRWREIADYTGIPYQAVLTGSASATERAH